jgi:hypothetical protein
MGGTFTNWRTDAVATLLTCWEARDGRSMTNTDFKRCVDATF